MNKRFKQFICLLGVGVLTISTVMGCGNNQATPTESENVPVETEATEQPAETQAPEASTETVTESQFNDVPLKEAASEEIKDIYDAEVYNYKVIRNLPTLYTAESYDAYCASANILLTLDVNTLNDTQVELVKKSATLRSQLVQVKSYEEGTWMLWNEQMPTMESADSLEFTLASYDNSDFKPYLLPYLLENQEEVKGNMIVIAGGGYSSRGNAGEGYPIATEFNKLGYNAYVLQRRVEPYSPEDIWLDMQRSIRLVKYQIETMNLGGEECICAAGFSGGSGTILGQIASYYGDIKPSTFDPSYKDDAIDGYNADLTVACTMYGPNYTFGPNFNGLETENPNLPAFFIAGGADDDLTYEDDFKLAASVKGKVPVEVHTFANVGHGFGVGVTGTNSTYWIPMADQFITQVIGASQKAEMTFEVPDEYTKTQSYVVPFGFGDTEVTCNVDETGKKFYITFVAFESAQVLEGVVGDDGAVTITYDASGFFSGDAQMIWDSADPNAYVPR